MGRKIIAVCGRARSGKDEFINALIRNSNNKPITVLRYSEPLKQECIDILSLDSIEELDYHKNNNILVDGVNVRRLLQITADKNKENNPTYYADILNNKIENISEDETIIVADLRMLIEEETLINKYPETVIIKITRSDYDMIEESDHGSESEIDEIDYDILINNNGTLEDLEKQAIIWVDEYKI